MNNMNILLSLSITLVVALLSTRLVKLLKLPNVTGFLIVGIFLGPYFWQIVGLPKLAIISGDTLPSLDIIVNTALGFIAFSIGGEFKLQNLKKMGKRIFIITLFQSLLALVMVDVFLIVICLFLGKLQEFLPMILILGAVATATAPAATLMVIRQYKAKGEVTDTLLPVVALDDAFGLIFFAISFSVASSITKGSSLSFLSIIIIPLLQIISSLAIGGILGFLLYLSMKIFKSHANRLCLMIAFTILGVAICELFINNFNFEMSSLLTCMMIGAVFCNFKDDASIILEDCNRWTTPLFMMFFVISGSQLDFSVMGSSIVLLIGIVYLIARSAGKYFGARLGAVISHSSPNVKKYLGLTLLPQAGVAIGMAHSASSALKDYGNIASQITAVVLCATLVYELIGPVITEVALTKAGEITVVKRNNKDLISPTGNS